MELNFITFNSILHGNLMPWLEENQDPEKFRLILRNLATRKPNNSGEFFGFLADVFMEMRINPGQELIDEWGILVFIPWHPLSAGIINPFLQLPDNNPKLTFYTRLIAHSMAALLTMITIRIAESESETMQKHRVMGYMKGLSMMISSAGESQPTGLLDRAIMNRLLAGSSMLFAEAWDRFQDIIEPAMLSVNKTDIRNIFLGTSHEDENTRAFFKTLADRYFPEPTPSSFLSYEGTQEHADVHVRDSNADLVDNQIIMEEVGKAREDLTALKEVLAGFSRKKETKPETQDRRIGSAEVCAKLNISKSTLKAHREKGEYACTKIGSRYYYSARQIDEIAMIGINHQPKMIL